MRHGNFGIEKIFLKSDFWRGKKVFVTGHSGFKGSWLSLILDYLGAEVTGYALPPVQEINLFELTNLKNIINSNFGNVENFVQLQKVFDECKPEIVIHMAAQPLVSEGYSNPRGTFNTNIMGTVNICECVRQSDSVKSFLNVTTDKVYYNREWFWGYRETDELGGVDPYSCSKSCSELVTRGYKESFLNGRGIAVSTARAGNVIGGGDFSPNRILPDCIRAVIENHPIELRNPKSVRPYQHVLEAVFGYLLIAQAQFENIKFADSYNIGPDDADCITNAELADIFCNAWGDGASWLTVTKNLPHESNLLKLDCSLMKNRFSWRPKWNVEKAVEYTVDWVRHWRKGENILATMRRHIEDYLN